MTPPVRSAPSFARTARPWLAGAWLLAAGCATRPPAETAVYVVRPTVGAAVEAPANAPRLRLAAPEVASHIRGFGFVDADGRVSTFVSARPAAPIEEIVTDAAIDRLRAAGRWSAVLPPTHPGRATAVLRLRLRRFEIDASGGGYVAIAALEGTLDQDDAREVRGSFAVEGRSEPASAAAPDVVRALETALGAALDRMIESVAATPMR